MCNMDLFIIVVIFGDFAGDFTLPHTRPAPLNLTTTFLLPMALIHIFFQ